MNRISDIIGIPWAREQGLTGLGVTVAVLDTGAGMHPDFADRIVAFRDFERGRREIYDDNSHGTHVCGIIGGDGRLSCGRYCGVAPKCNLLPIKVLDGRGLGNVGSMIKGIEYILEVHRRYNLRIVNISVGTVDKGNPEKFNELLDMVEKLWDAGLIVVAAAGNEGPRAMSITIPGTSKKIITVGAYDDERYNSNKGMAYYSGRGPTDCCIVKPEIVEPGNGIISCSTNRNGYSTKSGTSMATPVLSGILALLLEKYPYMTNKEVKLRLYERAVDLGLPKSRQGWGRIEIRKLLS